MNVARTITRHPSLFGCFFDDIISALSFGKRPIFNGLSGKVVGLSTRIIYGKSMVLELCLPKYC